MVDVCEGNEIFFCDADGRDGTKVVGTKGIGIVVLFAVRAFIIRAEVRTFDERTLFSDTFVIGRVERGSCCLMGFIMGLIFLFTGGNSGGIIERETIEVLTDDTELDDG